MKTKSNFIRDLTSVIFSNLLMLVSSILVGFVLPKIMGVEQYGYYKLFMLYATYAILLCFGFVDGVLVVYGGQTADKIDHSAINYLSRFLWWMELIVSIVLFVIDWLFLHGEYRLIFSLLSIFTLLSNLFTYYRYLAQAMMQFNVISWLNLLESILTCGIVVLCYLLVHLGRLSQLTARFYLIAFLVMFVVLLVIILRVLHPSLAIKTRRQLTRVQKHSLLKKVFKIGLPVTISSQISTLILNLDNQIISFFFNTRIFGIYSFAYSLISVISTIIVPISTVIFPFLNRQEKAENIRQYSFNTTILFIFVYLALVVYYPICLFIDWYLPQYTASLFFFRLLLPGVGISSCISILVFNYYKVWGRSRVYLSQGVIVFIALIIVNLLTYYLTKSANAIAVVSLIGLFSWYIYTNYYLVCHYHVRCLRNVAFMLIMIAAFEIVTMNPNLWLSLISYLFICGIMIALFYHQEVKLVIQFILRSKRKGR